MKTISITISGKVQGVFYRQSTRERAVELGVTGEVRNLPDGNVLIIATGTEEQLQSLAEWCRSGPPKARVSGIEVNDLPARSFERFSIIRS